ncbi:hypothetical protein [Asticcacaulis machinosus]|uniref:Uncharacterized protein n=1 Tax=Asticcacaulis machinosus TaxID=2984211 RepID=A0ABT5HM26_9CAUL|nr:hypothetical protein [Asticcacaulis machinosus]MDC7677185.1 hypothetical protein [Asticcacaulis machinosus]
MSSLFVRLTLCGMFLSATSITAQAAPARDAGNLNWPGKSVADAAPKAGQYGVPPSPYGDVGNFFKKELKWPTKPTQTVPAAANSAPVSALPQVSSTEPSIAEPRSPRPERYVSAPVEAYTYRPQVYTPVPQVASRTAPSVPMASLTTPPPLPAPAPRLTPEQMRELETAPAPTQRVAVKPVPKPVTMAPIPNPAPQVAEAKSTPKATTAVATAPTPSAPTTAPDMDAYQIPRTSKYYRGPQTDTAPQSAPGTAAGVGFTPGQTITDPTTQSPRFYSLHREYGLSPDTIQQTQEPGQNDLPVANESASPR